MFQCNLRKSVEANMSLLEKDKIMIQHRATEHQRKADQEAEKRRNLENEGENSVSSVPILPPIYNGAIPESRLCDLPG